MPVKKTVKKKPAAKKKTKSKVGSTPGAALKKYNSVIQNTPAVKSQAAKLKKLEAQIKLVKKAKATAVKAARKKYSSTH